MIRKAKQHGHGSKYKRESKNYYYILIRGYVVCYF